MRSVLIGAVGTSAVVLRALQRAGAPPQLVLTLSPEKGASRHSDYEDLTKIADESTETVWVDECSDADILAMCRKAEPDFLFVVGWSRMVGRELRETASQLAIGYHPTALPQLRGRAALAWTILLGLEETASSLFVLGDGVDTGALLAQERFVIDARETIGTLLSKHYLALTTMLDKVVPSLIDGSWELSPQDEAMASYAAVRRAGDGIVDWSMSAEAIDRLVRATSTPYPGAFTFTAKRRIAIHSARPVELSNPHYGQLGQVVAWLDGSPIVMCGQGTYLAIEAYEADDGRPLVGQPRFFDRPRGER